VRDITVAARKKLLKYHPDKNPNASEEEKKEMEEETKLINNAREVLEDKTSRQAYDERRGEASATGDQTDQTDQTYQTDQTDQTDHTDHTDPSHQTDYSGPSYKNECQLEKNVMATCAGNSVWKDITQKNVADHDLTLSIAKLMADTSGCGPHEFLGVLFGLVSDKETRIKVYEQMPRWALDKLVTPQVGSHWFYSLTGSYSSDTLQQNRDRLMCIAIDLGDVTARAVDVKAAILKRPGRCKDLGC